MAEQSSMRRDIVSAYLASGAKIASWVVVSGIVYRVGGSVDFGILALVRGTIGILSYVSLGLGPALVRLLAEAAGKPPEEASAQGAVLSYYRPQERFSREQLYGSALCAAVLTGGIALALVGAYAMAFPFIHKVPTGYFQESVWVAGMMGLGLVFRLGSDAPGAVLQTSDRIAADNYLLAEAEMIWMGLVTGRVLLVGRFAIDSMMGVAAVAYFISSLLLLIRRVLAARKVLGPVWWMLEFEIVKKFFLYGGLITLAQLADYLYAPTDYILINHFLGAGWVAIYAPAVQIDAGLLVLVSGLAAVLFPRSAIAHARGDVAAVRRYYLRGTIASAGILLIASVLMWAAAPLLFRLWLGNPMPITRSILPLVLIHTTIGGSAMVGRSVLLAAGKFRPFAISVLLAGAINVIFSYIFVKYFQLGLRGIIYGTIIAVVARCVLWMPWYVMRSLRDVKELPVQPMAAPEL